MVVPDTPYNLLTTRGRHNNVSVLLGSNAGEMVAWYLNQGSAYPYNYNQTTVDDQVGFESGYNSTVVGFYNLAVFNQRYNTTTDINHVYVVGLSAQAYQCPSRRVAVSMARGGAAVWQYSWNYLQASSSSAWTGLAAHSAEQPLIFYHGGDAEDAVMAAQTQNYLHRFIAHGNPNTVDPAIDDVYAKVYGDNTLVTWPQFDPDGTDITMTTRNGSMSGHFVPLAGVHAEQCEQLWDYTVPHPLVVQRVTQCANDECSTLGYANRCVDNYNGTYYCVCSSPQWMASSDRQKCMWIGSSTGANSLSSSSSSSSGSGDDASGGSCDAWCFVAIVMIVLLSLGFLFMIYRMYANSQRPKEPAVTNQRRAVPPRTSTGQPVPVVSSSAYVSEGGDVYNVTGEPSVTSPASTVTSTPSGRVVKKKKRVKKIRVDTGTQPLLADDRV